ncbi:hypothetical protein LCGC14_1308460 [marine sediment metagenome]|uniref:Uncharacterized protein n=1 Tax=marine sediment metagenome TaxID=412755 RepID=A0A0F9L7X0_9ZZZZ
MVKGKEGFEVIEVPTSTERKIRDIESGEVYDLTESVCKMWNELKEVRRAVVG